MGTALLACLRRNITGKMQGSKGFGVMRTEDQKMGEDGGLAQNQYGKHSTVLWSSAQQQYLIKGMDTKPPSSKLVVSAIKCLHREGPALNDAPFLGWNSEQPLIWFNVSKIMAELLASQVPARGMHTEPQENVKWVCCAQLKSFLLSPQWRWQSKHMFNIQMCLSNGKKNIPHI